MKRTLSALLAGSLALATSTGTLAWDVDWSNHRSIKVRVQNHYTEELRILGYDYTCVNNKPAPVNIPPAGGKGTSEFEWSHNAAGCNGDAWAATLGVNLRGQGKQVCVIYLSTSQPESGGKVKNFQAKTDHATNCKVDVSPDPKDPRDTVWVRVAANATPRTPEPRPSPKTWDSNKCKVVMNYAPMCSGPNIGMVQDNCVYFDCRKCPDGQNYYFQYSFLQTEAQSNQMGCPQ
jgi:hypothetical protein